MRDFAILFNPNGIVSKSPDAYQPSLTTVQKNSLAIRRLGDPIEDKLFFSGNITLANGTGQAHLEIPVSGPNGPATTISDAAKDSGPWVMTSLTLRFPDGKTMELLESHSGEQSKISSTRTMEMIRALD